MSDQVMDAARAVRDRAYAPYSRFRVGAGLETEDGSVFVGCNVENASYGLSLCAERAALAAAVAAGFRRFRRLVVVSDSDPPASPCGACRQALAEFAPTLVVEAVGRRHHSRWTMAELLPAPFRHGARPAEGGTP